MVDSNATTGFSVSMASFTCGAICNIFSYLLFKHYNYSMVLIYGDVLMDVLILRKLQKSMRQTHKQGLWWFLVAQRSILLVMLHAAELRWGSWAVWALMVAMGFLWRLGSATVSICCSRKRRASRVHCWCVMRKASETCGVLPMWLAVT